MTLVMAVAFLAISRRERGAVDVPGPCLIRAGDGRLDGLRYSLMNRALQRVG